MSKIDMAETTAVRPGDWLDPGQQGAPLPYEQVIARAARAQVVLLGESHNRRDHHRWQMHVIAALLSRRRDIVVGFEMFPARLDPVLAEWVVGSLDEASFIERSEWHGVWGFEPELYMPIFRLCRDFGLPMRGLNCRRGLVSEVGKLGWDGIDMAAREGITPARPATRGYREYILSLGVRSQITDPDDPALDRFMRAQQTWDRAFACRLAQMIESPRPPLVVGIIGRGHLEFGHGTPFQLQDLGISAPHVLLPHDAGVPLPTGLADGAALFNERMCPGERFGGGGAQILGQRVL